MSSASTWQKEQLSRAYLHAVATSGGYTIASWSVDIDGVDATLRKSGLMIDLQLKCTSSPTVTSAGYSYPLDTPTYNKLRERNRSAPGYLALMIAPPDVGCWVAQHDKRLLLSCHAYWARIQDMTEQAKGETKSITLPTLNHLDAKALSDMFDDALHLVRRTA